MAVDLFAIKYISPLFNHILFMSITAVMIGLAVFVIRTVFDKRISPVWKYAMWTLVIVALILPFRPQTDFSLINNTSTVKANDYREKELSLREELTSYKTDFMQGAITEIDSAQQERLQAEVQTLHIKSLVFQVALPIIWLVGMVLSFLALILNRAYLAYKIKKHTICKNQFNNILLRCKEVLGIKGEIEIITQDYIKSPALVGLVRPKILLPDYVGEINEESLYYILLHELSHYKRKDMIVNYMLLALQAVHWFNPIVWLLFKYIREDMELLNDSAVLKAIGTELRQGYAKALVRVLELSHNVSLMPKLICMVDGKRNVQRRISMIKLTEVFKKHKIIVASCCLAVIILLGGLFLTQGKSDTVPLDTKFVVSEVLHQDLRLSMLYTTDNAPEFKVSKNMVLQAQSLYDDEWQKLGVLKEVSQSKEQLYEYFYLALSDKVSENIDKVKAVYQTAPENEIYLFMVLDDGDYLIGRAGTEKDSTKAMTVLYKVLKKTNLPEGAATNAEILEIDKENNTITVKGDKETIQLKNKLELKYNVNDLWENRTEYVGNNVKVGGILGALRYPEKITTNGFSLHTNEEPYAITLDLKTDTETRNFYSGSLQQAEFTKIAFVVFSLVENVQEMIFSIDDGVNPYDFTIYRQQANMTLYENSFDKTDTISGFEEVLTDIEKNVDASYEELRGKLGDTAVNVTKTADADANRKT